MKTKVNNEMVAHVWANYRAGNQISEEYSNYVEGSSMRTGGTQAEYLYSWKTLIGQRCEVFGQEFYLLSDTHYSPSTGKHQSHMHRAIPNDPSVPALIIKGRWSEQRFAENLDTRKGRLALANRLIDQNIEQAEKELASSKRRRSAHTRMGDLKAYVERLRAAVQVKILLHSTRRIPEPDQAVLQEIREWDAGADEREAQLVAKREIYDQKLREERQDQLDRWIAGEGVPSYGLHIFPTALRIRYGLVETTGGVTIKLEEAMKCYRKWKALKMRVGDSVGGFQFRGEYGGIITIGCHKIPVSEIERVFSGAV